MQETDEELDALLNKMLPTFEEKMPFNKLLGIQIVSLHLDEVKIRFDMREALIGNFVHGILHGGVIASVLDVAGGMIAIANSFKQRRENLTEAERMQGIDKTGTIDMRIDYLRPGRGVYFIATSTILRSGRKVTVTRMELHNDEDLLIAVGTGCYLVG
ncbi:thioesterase family protein [Beggiatoa leptomitoformis]|uniref:Medium/long-chain acyl-CoA thioesterase YigI n=1 Tax=Beggiatoa leptomitoformis TaxID=288004 RepID=A0A2N9YA88_9GAMM|nr:thioesterase family protein [Beggiatoa leptomitoformis]ALG67214.1 thioesterase family protein [Beggiatoa leptomitoformis]AUI67373.1 thioesterase family protein [Beggiatoa leptomitoformis]